MNKYIDDKKSGENKFIKSGENEPDESIKSNKNEPINSDCVFINKYHPNYITQSNIITSWGTVCYTKDKTSGRYLFLIAEMRDSIPYREFIRGRIPYNDIEKYISLMSYVEIDRLLGFYKYREYIKGLIKFDEFKKYLHMTNMVINTEFSEYEYQTRYFTLLWNDLWVQKNTTMFLIEKNKSMDIFISNMNEFSYYFNRVERKHKSFIFTKGRQKNKESTVKCAIRETSEETGIKSSLINVRLDVDSIIERYKGNDNKIYETGYFLAKLNYQPKKNYKYIGYESPFRKKFISGEIQEIQWKDYNTLMKMGNLDFNKKKILQYFNNILLNDDNKYIDKFNNKFPQIKLSRRWSF